MDIVFTLQSTADGSLLTGQAANVTVYLSIDGAAFTASTNAAAEIGRGAYKLTLTSAEAAFQTLLYAPVCTGAQSNILMKEADPVMPTVPTAAQNAAAVWGAQTKIVNIDSTQIATLATSDALSAVASNVSAVKAKTDNLPASPAATSDVSSAQSAIIAAIPSVQTIQSGLATTLNVSAAQTAIINRGNEAWLTATGFTVPGDLLGLATTGELVNNLNLLTQHGNTYWVTATGFATPSDIPSTQDIWEYPDRELTSEISVEISDENIADITESVWNADDRTLTDLTPKPNQKNIVCTPSNVINAYGIQRLENWTNETSGTQAFDDKINTYITLAKEKMATDLNDHINAAIDYIGADNITELCAWLTGYNLYKDDESTDTDSLPETRYNQYLEQIHRIMENI